MELSNLMITCQPLIGVPATRSQNTSHCPPVTSCTTLCPSASLYRRPISFNNHTASTLNGEPRAQTWRQHFRGIRVGAQSSQFGQGLGQGISSGARWYASTWLDNIAQVEVDVPLSNAWDLWQDKENVTNWMPWIASVKVRDDDVRLPLNMIFVVDISELTGKVLEDKPEMSKWTLRYEAFGQKFEFSWLARNLKPMYHQKIHWRSVDGLPNRGAVRFYPRGPTTSGVQLTISYEVPDVLAPFASVLSPLVESILQQDLNRFAKYAKSLDVKSGKA